MALAQYTAPEDAVALVKYLRTKATGATVSETKATLGATVVDNRKLAALESWGFIDKEGDRLKLAELGRELARDFNRLPVVAMRSVNSVKAYRQTLEWAHHQGFASLDTPEVGAYLHTNFPVDLGTVAEKGIAASVASFLKLAEAAGLGTFILGRKGLPTRLELNRDRLSALIEEGPEEPPWIVEAAAPEVELIADDGDGGITSAADELLGPASPAPADPMAESNSSPLKVFITHGKNMELVDQVKTMLDLAEIPFEVAVDEETSAIPVPEKVLGAMRRCTAGVMIVSVDPATDGNVSKINDNVLIEVGAAFVLYDRRVVLVWDRRIPVPSNLQGLYRCEFEGEEMSWASGMKLMKALRGFKSSEAQ